MEILKILDELKRPAISIRFQNKTGLLPPNASKFGGRPYLPNNFEWPYFTGSTKGSEKMVKRPLTFLLQINLAEISQYDKNHLLPASGMLYFFYEYASMKWGFEAEDKGCAQVFYCKDSSNEMSEIQPPPDFYDYVMDEEDEFPELAISFEAMESVPDYDEFTEYYGDDYDWEEYESVRNNILGCSDETEPKENSHLLGYADKIQYSMLLECESIANEINNGGETVKLSNQKQLEETEQSNAWTLLLQLDEISDGNGFDVEWEDGGSLYFYIKKDDLQAMRFDNICFSLQCE